MYRLSGDIAAPCTYPVEVMRLNVNAEKAVFSDGTNINIPMTNEAMKNIPAAEYITIDLIFVVFGADV